MGMHEHDSVLEGMTLSLAFTVLLCGIALLSCTTAPGRVVLAMLLRARRRRRRDVRDRVGDGRSPQRDDGVSVRDRRRQRHQRGADPRRAVPRGAARRRTRTRTRSRPAIAGALPGTLAATATAAVAYGSLLITDFRGFRQFGAIAGIGMVRDVADDVHDAAGVAVACSRAAAG